MRTLFPQTERAPVNQRLSLGIRSLDAFTPVARGQRLGIFAGPGVGKSVLMGMIARATEADVIVMALVGERGREVGHFAADILGPEGMKKSVLVVATSDRPPSERLRASFVATTLAEYYRDQGKSVLLFVDSLTRFAMAQREIGLAVGEPPTTRGYPPSTFAMMPKLLERVAPSVNGGSVTAFYTVLVEGDDMTDPVGDAARRLARWSYHLVPRPRATRALSSGRCASVSFAGCGGYYRGWRTSCDATVKSLALANRRVA